MHLNGILCRTKGLTRYLALSFALVMLSNFAWAADKSQTLLVVGDSLSAGYGIPQGEEWVQRLSDRLKVLNPEFSVVNASISGDTTAGGLSRLPALLKQEKPDWVLLELGGNDGLRGMSLQAMKNNLIAMLDLVEKSGARAVLVGIKIPPNYGKKYTQKFEQVFVDVAEQKQVPLLPFLLDGVAGWDQYMQADRIHPNTLAQPIIEELVWEFLEPILLSKESAPAMF